MLPATLWRGLASNPLRLVLLAFVAMLALDHYTNHLSRTPGIDFYQYWAVPTARRVSDEALGSPYADSASYAEVLAGIAERSTDNRLKAVAEYRQEPGFASDPLLYVVGGWLPTDYTLALRLYQALQAVALALGLCLLARTTRAPGLETATLGLLMCVYYMPVLSELRVLNTNALLLAGIACAACLLGRGSRASATTDGIAASALVVVAFLKPLWSPLVALAFIQLLWTRGALAIRKPVVAAGVVGLALAAWPAAVFGPGVWLDWYRTVYRDDPAHLVYAVAEGNRSTPLILTQMTGWSLATTTVLVAAVLLAAVGLAVLVLRSGPQQPSGGEAVRSLSGRLLERPEVTLSLGIVALLALSPLVWWHYYTIALVPLFVLAAPGTTAARAVLAVLSMLLASGRLGPVYAWFTDADWATAVGVSLAWLPLWIGLLTFGVPRRGPKTAE